MKYSWKNNGNDSKAKQMQLLSWEPNMRTTEGETKKEKVEKGVRSLGQEEER
jgi:hypothetical protein